MIAVFNFLDEVSILFMERKLTYQISGPDGGLSIVQFLRKRGFSGGILTSMKEDWRNICLNGEPSFGNAHISPGDILSVTVPETDHSFPEAIPLPVSVVYEDEDIVVLNKPADMPVHPSVNNHGNTLSNALAFHAASRGERYPFRCLNRLDRDTSGLVVAAKNPLSASVLGADIKERRVKRQYLALAEGRTEETGTISLPIGRCPDSVLKRQADPVNGKSAVTHYERLSFRDPYSLLLVTLETGRTHQIRVHLSAIGHPIPGDFLYHPDFSRIGRQALHAFCLTMRHPITRQEQTFFAPVPEDFRAAWGNGGKIPLNIS